MSLSLLLKYLFLSAWLTFLQRLLPLIYQGKCLSDGFVFNPPSYQQKEILLAFIKKKKKSKKQAREALVLLVELPDLANQNTGHPAKTEFQINNKYYFTI